MAKNENVKSAKVVDIRPQRATPAPMMIRKGFLASNPRS